MKICTKCKVPKLLNSFTVDNTKKDKLRPICRECDIKHQKKFRKKYPWKVTYWGIKNRCNNKNCKRYKDYGGRGIQCLITEEELKTLWFRDKAYLMKRPTIDKNNNNGDYEFNNCSYIEHFINTGKDSKKPILQYDLQGNFLREWESAIIIYQQMGYQAQNISKVCLGKRIKANGFIWRFKNG